MIADLFALFAIATLWVFVSVVSALWMTGIVTDINRRLWLMTVLDIACPPVGVVRGMLIWFAAEKIRQGTAAERG